MSGIRREKVEVLIIGAGPSGSLASTLLNKNGLDVLVLEKQIFPRFSIGESLLPQVMSFLEKADMLDAVISGDYQLKNGAFFIKGDKSGSFNFEEKFSEGWGTTFEVKRAEFDKRLADTAEAQGVTIRYQHEVLSMETFEDHCLVIIQDDKGENYEVEAGFILDASGFGRVLPKLLGLEQPSTFPVRRSIFCHMKDNISSLSYDRNKIIIAVHPKNNNVWYWLIPFSDGTCSVGIVGIPDFFETLSGTSEDKLMACINSEPRLASLLRNAEIITKVQEITGYSANVKSLYGKHFALLGNAGEFLDPVFSSGVTIAFKSADLAASLLIRQKNGEELDWEKEYSQVLMKGVDTFRVFVNAWYDGSLQDIIFFPNSSKDIKEKICAILAGYAWDETNPYVQKTERRVRVLAEICKA